jgi:hypothetical protein
MGAIFQYPILKNFVTTSINTKRDVTNLERKAFDRTRPEDDSRLIKNGAMRKALESEPNQLTISTRPTQVRAISGTMALALVLLFVMAALGTAFLLLQ